MCKKKTASITGAVFLYEIGKKSINKIIPNRKL